MEEKEIERIRNLARQYGVITNQIVSVDQSDFGYLVRNEKDYYIARGSFYSVEAKLRECIEYAKERIINRGIYEVVGRNNYVLKIEEAEGLKEAIELAEMRSEGSGVFTVAIFDSEGRIVEIR